MKFYRDQMEFLISVVANTEVELFEGMMITWCNWM